MTRRSIISRSSRPATGRQRARYQPPARGKPKMVVSDNDSQLTGNAILTWAYHTRVE
jgi:hypothetical protein